MTSPPEPPPELPVIETRQSVFQSTRRHSAFGAGFSATFGVACALIVIGVIGGLAWVLLVLLMVGGVRMFQ